LSEQKTPENVEAIFKRLTPSGMPWQEIEALLLHLGASISEGRGSRLRIRLNGEDAVFHHPHPRKETDKGAIASLRRFLENTGVKP
jgi:hypothetical protein